MFRWLKNHFIPHSGNDRHPHLLRTEATIFLLAIVIIIEVAFLASTIVLPSGTSFFSLILPQALVQSANADRGADGLGTLTAHQLLEQSAALKAQDMASKGYFAHTSPEGRTPWYWLERVGYSYASAGENLAVNFIDSSDVHSAWMNSPSHRANIMNAGYTEIGIATATGMYKGNEAVFVVQYFGKPKTKPGIAVAPRQVQAAETFLSATFQPLVTAIPALAKAEVVSPILTTITAEPRKTTQSILLIIGGLVLFALLLTALIRFELPHPRIVIAPMLLLAVIFTALVVNTYIGLFSAQI